jgi:tight adherence protein C
MLYVLLLVFTGSAMGFLAAHNLLSRNNAALSSRATAILSGPAPGIRERELDEPLSKRIIKPIISRVTLHTSRWLPSEKEALLAKKIEMAGRPGGFGPREFTALKIIITAPLICLVFLLETLISLPGEKWLLFTAFTVIAGWYLPDLYLRQKILERQTQVVRTLPDVLDLLTVSVEAGMALDGALLKVVDKSKGILAGQFLKVLQECKMGKPRREALRDMADRMGVDDLSTFTGSVIQAEQLGLGLGNVLRLQSEQMRQKRRQRAEESAMKAPVKMMIPMVLFIFPTIFVVLLGPAVISILNTF